MERGLGSAFGNNPFISNARIRNLTTTASNIPRSDLENALQDIGNNEQTLRAGTHDILNQTYPLYRLQYLYEGILSYHNYIYPQYVDKEDMNTPRFKSDNKFTDMWIKALDPKREFRRIVAEVMAEGKKAYVLRQEYCVDTNKERVDYVMLQNLPSDYYRIVNITNDSYYAISFNFFYFMTPGTSLDHFPPVFRKIYNELMGIVHRSTDGTIILDYDAVKDKSGVTIEYNSISRTWAYWADLPSDLVWTFCFTEADAFAASPFVSLLLLGSDLANYNLLQQQLVSAPLNTLILGELLTDSTTKHSGYAVDNFSLSPEAMNLFEGRINDSLANSNIAFKMTPSVKNQMFNIPNIPNAQTIYNEAIKGVINTAGSGALQTLSERPTVAQSNAAKITEFRFIDRIYRQFEHFVNTIFSNMKEQGELKFLWRFKIFGNSYLDDKEFEKFEKSLALGQKQFFLDYVAMADRSLLDVSSQIDYIDSIGIYDKFVPLVSSYQGGMDSKSIGRPTEDDTDNENTAASKDQGMNEEREDI